jgi:hypothetical protein
MRLLERLNTRFHVWLVNLLRAALNDRLNAIDDRLALIESHFASIAIRVKEKQAQQKVQRPRTWSEAKERLEAETTG